ncbi:MAG: hypothetical protein V4459_08815 [Pseudomonadota bacterium]
MSAPDQITRTAVLALIVAAAMFWLMLDNFTKDMVDYLLPWLDHIRATGPVASFAAPFGNYTPPYLYLLAIASLAAPFVHPVILIKLLSLAGTFMLAAAVWRLLVALDTPLPGRKALIVMALPSVALNSDLFAQCDAMWAAACVMGLTAAVGRRHAAMLAWCGLAVAIKLQPVFSAPLIVALLIGRQVPWRLWAIAPLTFVAAMVPAVLMGWPLADIATIYFRQADWSPALSMNAPNIWAIAQALPLIGALPLTGLAMASAIGASAWLIARFAHRPPAREQVIAAALLVTLVTVGLLPRMHERYFFLADVLALVLALAHGNRRNWIIAGLVEAGSMLGLSAYLVGIDGLAVIGTVAMVTATVMVARPFLASPANDNGLPLNSLGIYPA